MKLDESMLSSKLNVSVRTEASIFLNDLTEEERELKHDFKLNQLKHIGQLILKFKH